MTIKIDATMKMDEAVNLLLQLRKDADAAGELLMKATYEVEHHAAIWQGSGWSFAEWLEKNHIMKPTRYLAWKRVRENLGADAVDGVGVEAVVAAGSLKSPDVQRDLIGQARAWESTNGTTISEQSARKIANDAKVRDAAMHGATKAKGYLDVVRDNDHLRSRVEELQQRCDALEAEVRFLKNENKTLKAATKGKGKPAPRASA